MFRRIFNFLLLTVMVVGAGVVYDLKHKAELAADHNARLEADIARDRDAVALLRAEWSLLTQPSRLQTVIDKYADHFQLQPFSPTQIATIDEIPMRPAPGTAPATASAADPLGAAVARLTRVE
ncbi:MAG: hypothetical protein WDM84_07510 [Bauldia sp.]